MPLAAVAVPITAPTGLKPGDQYRLAFVTSSTYQGYHTGIGSYNSFVTGVANTIPELVALGTTWKAIASTATVDARDNTNTNPGSGVGVPIFLLNDTMLANNNADLWDGSIDNALNINQFGNTSYSGNVWTGTLSTGTKSFYCLGCNPNASNQALPGYSSAVNFTWIARDASLREDYNKGFRVYAISDTLTFVPEPSTALLMMAGLIGLAARGRRKRA
jgi:hypothetical protein